MPKQSSSGVPISSKQTCLINPVLIPATSSLSHVGWLTIYARPIKSAPTYYKRGRMWVLLKTEGSLFVAYNQAELKTLVSLANLSFDPLWYEANIIDIEETIGYELEAED